MAEMSKICVVRLTEGGQKLNGARQISEEIITEIFLKLTKYIKSAMHKRSPETHSGSCLHERALPYPRLYPP